MRLIRDVHNDSNISIRRSFLRCNRAFSAHTFILVLYLLVFFPCFSVANDVFVTLEDDTGVTVELDHPAARIVSLTPHVTELLFAAGASDKIIATVEFSDYPREAKKIARIGDAWHVDREALIALQPDLVIAWASGTPAREIEALRKMNMRVFLSEPRQLQDIGEQIRVFGKLADTAVVANRAAARYEQSLLEIRNAYAGRERIRVFNQIGIRPLMTVNGEHLINAVLKLCGGENVFADLGELAPVVSTEAVIGAEPQVIVYAVNSRQEEAVIESFWSELAGGQFASGLHYIGVPADTIHRQTPRILEGARQICVGLERVRGECER